MSVFLIQHNRKLKTLSTVISLTRVYEYNEVMFFCLHIDKSFNTDELDEILDDSDCEVGDGYESDNSDDIYIRHLQPSTSQSRVLPWLTKW